MLAAAAAPRDGPRLHSFLTSDLGAPLPLHISLSRPLSLPGPDKDAFLDRLARSLAAVRATAFAVRPAAFAWHQSPASPRAFLVLGVVSARPPEPAASPNPELAALLARCNAVAAHFGQPSLYQAGPDADADASAFHVSIAWAFAAPDEATSRRVHDLFAEEPFCRLASWEIPVSAVKAKMGNVVNHLALGDARRPP